MRTNVDRYVVQDLVREARRKAFEDALEAIKKMREKSHDKWEVLYEMGVYDVRTVIEQLMESED